MQAQAELDKMGSGADERNPDPYEPCPEVLRVRKMLGLNTERTNEDYQAICDRLGALAKVKAERVEEAIPEIGEGLPDGCPIIPAPTPITEPARWGARTYTAAEMNRATLEHRNREQAKFAEDFRVRAARKFLTVETAKAEPPTMQERITTALTGADPLTTAAVREVVGGRKHTVSKALLELSADGRVDMTRVNPRMYLWSLTASGSREGGTARGGTPPPTGVGGSHPLGGQSDLPGTPRGERETMKAETTIQGSNTQEKAASIIALLKAGEIEAGDFAILLKREVPEFVEAYKIAVGQ